MVNIAAPKHGRCLFFFLLLSVATASALRWSSQDSASGEAGHPNLVVNGGFEDDPAGATQPSHWEVPADLGALDTKEFYSGAQSLRLIRTDADKYGFATQALPCTPGGRYKFSAWIKGEDLVSAADDDNRGAGIFMEYYDAAGQWLGGSYPSGQLEDRKSVV